MSQINCLYCGKTLSTGDINYTCPACEKKIACYSQTERDVLKLQQELREHKKGMWLAFKAGMSYGLEVKREANEDDEKCFKKLMGYEAGE